MATAPSIDVDQIAARLQLAARQVARTAELLDEGNTVPFITRYRKDQTGGLDEVQVRQVQIELARIRQLAERKQTILRSIETQGKLTAELAATIEAADTTKALEDLYLPFKPKKQTLATQARERGLEPLADEILSGASGLDLRERAEAFVDAEKQLATVEDVLAGVGHIIAEVYSERADLRQALRRIYRETAQLISAGQPANTSEPAAEDKPLAEQVAGEQAVSEAAAEKNAPAENSSEGQTDTPSEDQDTAAEKSAAETIAPEPTSAAEATSAVESTSAAPQAIEPPLAQKIGGEKTAARKKSAKKKRDKSREQQEKLRHAFRDYFDFRQKAVQVPPHRVLAINRGERKKILKVRVEVDGDAIRAEAERLLLPAQHPHRGFLQERVSDALARLILPSLERELRRELTDKAEDHAAEVFAKNLRNLLLQPPIHGRRVLAVDPGFRSGAKLVALDEFGSPLANALIHVVGSDERLAEGRAKLREMIDEHRLNVVAIGNGTGSREAEKLVGAVLADELAGRGIGYAVVNEAGASVYSTSQLGRDEFPDYDATVRGAVSIGRRLLDPLSELVKIDPASIGVGLYQHDVKAKHLRESLDAVVESCVNYVGVDVNSASPALLRYVSGLNQLTAQRIFEHRKQHGPFRSRAELREVSGLGDAKFVQAAGFLKIPGGENPLDASWIHPESYDVASRVLDKLGVTVGELAAGRAKSTSAGNDADANGLAVAETVVEQTAHGDQKPAAIGAAIAAVDREQLAGELAIGPLLLEDILKDLMRPGRDPREDLPPPIFRHEVLKLEDLEAGMELAGTVLNVVDFGAFIDIGLHDSALVHISQLGTRYVRDPHDVVSVGDVVRVWVMSTDKERRRVALTMIAPGTEKVKHERLRKERRADSTPRPPRKRRDAKAKPAGAQRGRGQAPYQPKPKPKPSVPLTEGMKKGVEPLRTFGDLAQFVELKRSGDADKSN
jgi:uncharacterized protein